MAAVGKFGLILAMFSFAVILFYLLPNKESIPDVSQMSYIFGGLFFFGIVLAILGARRHARKHGWIS